MGTSLTSVHVQLPAWNSPPLSCHGKKPAWADNGQVGSDRLLVRVVYVAATPRVVPTDESRRANEVCGRGRDVGRLTRPYVAQASAQLRQESCRLNSAKGGIQSGEIAVVSCSALGEAHSMVCVRTRMRLEGKVPAVVFLRVS